MTDLDNKNIIELKTLDDDIICAICKESLYTDPVTKLICKHEFHMECLDKWKSSNHNTCPNCRSEIIKPKSTIAMMPQIELNNILLSNQARDNIPLSNQARDNIPLLNQARDNTSLLNRRTPNIYVKFRNYISGKFASFKRFIKKNSFNILFIILAIMPGLVLLIPGVYLYISDKEYCDSYQENNCKSISLSYTTRVCPYTIDCDENCSNKYYGKCFDFVLTYSLENNANLPITTGIECGAEDYTCVLNTENTYNTTKIFPCYTTNKNEVLISNNCEIDSRAIAFIIMGAILLTVTTLYLIIFSMIYSRQ